MRRRREGRYKVHDLDGEVRPVPTAFDPRALSTGPNHAHVATLRPDGSPRSSSCVRELGLALIVRPGDQSHLDNDETAP